MQLHNRDFREENHGHNVQHICKPRLGVRGDVHLHARTFAASEENEMMTL